MAPVKNSTITQGEGYIERKCLEAHHMSPEFTAAVGVHNRSRKRLDILSANVVPRYQSL